MGGHLILALLGWQGSASTASASPAALSVRLLQAEVRAETASPASVDGLATSPSDQVGLPGPAPAAAAKQPEPVTAPFFNERDYLPRRELSVAPVMKVEVPLVWPPEGVLAGHYEDVATLFIDETGQVQHVRFEGKGLPPLLQERATEAFFGSRFSPGEVEGRPSKSRIRLQVAFDSPGQVLRGGSGL